uniref:Ciliary neurotrophic factor n=1 Tax=Oryzias latipes TaxID=8090 RepID=A0A3P9MQK6_ORYLA
MADRRTRSMKSSNLSRTAVNRASMIALQLQGESSKLLELYRQKESFPADATDGRLVLVPPPSSQLDSRDKLWRLHSALLQTQSLLEKAITKEEEELGGGIKGEYENQRKTVKGRLSFLLLTTGNLLKAVDGAASLTPSLEGLELDGPTTLFQLKLWLLQVFSEVHHWSKAAVTTLQELLTNAADERSSTTRVRSTRSARR